MGTFRFLRRWRFVALCAVVLAMAAGLLFFGFERAPFRAEDFVSTTLPTFGQPASPTLQDRIRLFWIEFTQKFRSTVRANPAAYTFPPTPANRCSIHGLLNQCMEVSGFRYLIAKEVAAGSVQFGHTNALTGSQWVAAFENALETGMPEWIDPKSKAFRKENLVLVRYPRHRTVLVLPKEGASEWQPSKNKNRAE